MPLFQKPQFNSVWANTGTRLTPNNAKISQGWIVEIPPHEFENWVQNRQDALLAHLNQVGIPMWDATVEYQATKSYVQGINSGIVYRANTTNTNINPELDIQGNWTIAFQAQGEALLKAQNLFDVPNKALARQNLGIPDTEFYDGRYLVKGSNLGDVPNKASARQNLDVYGKSETYTRYETDNLFPAGEIGYFARRNAPPGWLVCDGQWVVKSSYPRLYAAIGGQWGENSTHFAVPMLRGEFLRGWDFRGDIDPGRGFGSWQGSQNLSHNHWINDPGHIHTAPSSPGLGQGSGGINSVQQSQGNHNTSRVTTGITLSNDGGNESRPRNVAFLICIRA